MRRIERLINLIIALLEARRPMTATDIRAQIAGYDDQPTFDAFRRAFERDKEALRAMGVPLVVQKIDPLDEHSDGYLIPKERYYLPQLDLEPDELAALRIATEAVLGPGGEARSGWLKLSVDAAVTPETGPRVVWSDDLDADRPILGPLYEAQLERHPVRFGYRAASGEESVRTVEPHGLVNRRGHWYLVGRDVDRAAERSFRLSRVQGEMEVLEGTFDIPVGFEAVSHLPPDAWAIGEEPVEAVVRFDHSMRWWIEQNMHDLRSGEAPEGALDVTLTVANLDALVSWVLGFGAAVEIVAPDEARRRMLRRLDPLLASAP
jgi:predicted DNA-binding transcriptional regulator YafY